MYAEVGFLGARRMPAWKAEGYADYATHLADTGPDPRREILDRVALLADDVTETSARAELMARQHAE